MSEVKVDTISERTAANGIVVDGVTIKDNGITIPSGGTIDVNGTLDVTGATVTGLSAGKVLQFVVTQNHSPSVSIDNVTTYTTMGSTFAVSITPSATSSKIILNYGSARAGSFGTSHELRIKIYRQIGGGGYSEIESGLWQTTIKGIAIRPFHTQYVDSTHNTTSQIDYQLYMATSNNVDGTFADASPCLRYISAMEVGA
jgi:hypothetical protein